MLSLLVDKILIIESSIMVGCCV